MVNNLAATYVRFPTTDIEFNAVKNDFERKYGIPGIVGVVDGTHVILSSLPHNIEHAYVNRKGLHSINVQIVCDSNMMITNVNARYPGSTHDAFVFRNSQMFTHLSNIYNDRPNEWNFLLGKSMQIN